MSWKNRIVSYGEMAPEDLIPNPKNWRKHPKHQAAALEGVLDEIGWIQDVIVNQRTGRLLDGHLRVALAKQRGDSVVPIKIVDLSEEEEAKALLTLDPITSLAEADKEILQALMNEVVTDNPAIQKMIEGLALENKIALKEAIEDEYVPPPEIETDIKRGDIYQLGRHRVMCGDSTCREDVERLMQGKKADMVFTDPPYGISIVGGGGVPGKGGYAYGGAKNNIVRGTVGSSNILRAKEYPIIEGDESTDCCKECIRIIEAKNKIIFGGNYFTDFLPPSRCWLIWDKENTGNFADAELAWTSFEKGIKIYRWLWNGLSRKGSRDTEGISRVHPTQKPVGLFGEILKDFSQNGEIILDPFLGSGTTLIACEQLDRICYGMEIAPIYCQVIIDRWEKFTGKKAEKVTDT